MMNPDDEVRHSDGSDGSASDGSETHPYGVRTVIEERADRRRAGVAAVRMRVLPVFVSFGRMPDFRWLNKNVRKR